MNLNERGITQQGIILITEIIVTNNNLDSNKCTHFLSSHFVANDCLTMDLSVIFAVFLATISNANGQGK